MLFGCEFMSVSRYIILKTEAFILEKNWSFHTAPAQVYSEFAHWVDFAHIWLDD